MLQSAKTLSNLNLTFFFLLLPGFGISVESDVDDLA